MRGLAIEEKKEEEKSDRMKRGWGTIEMLRKWLFIALARG